MSNFLLAFSQLQQRLGIRMSCLLICLGSIVKTNVLELRTQVCCFKNKNIYWILKTNFTSYARYRPLMSSAIQQSWYPATIYFAVRTLQLIGVYSNSFLLRKLCNNFSIYGKKSSLLCDLFVDIYYCFFNNLQLPVCRV